MNFLLDNLIELQKAEKQSQKKINQHVIRLIQQKILPLNRLKYAHLQKINLAKKLSKKDQQIYLARSTLPEKDSQEILSNRCIKRFERHTTKNNKHATDELVNHLKRIKDIKMHTKFLGENKKTERCWESLRTSLIGTNLVKPDDQIKTHQKNIHINFHEQFHLPILDTDRSVRKFYTTKRKKQNFIGLTERAEKYLRIKKHELKLKHTEKEAEKINHKQSELEVILFEGKPNLKHVKSSKQLRYGSEEDLEKQLLKDIRENLLEEKINRIKKDINHRKIVQMR